MSNFTRWVSPLCMLVLLAVVGTGCTKELKASYHKKRADQYYADGKYDQSEIEYKNVLRQDPKNAEAWAHLGFIYFDEARTLEALQTLTRAAQLTTNNLPVRLKLGYICLNIGKFKEAREQAGFVLGMNPTDAQAPILLAEAAVTTNEVNEARQRLQTLVPGGKTAPLMVALGKLALREGDLKTAETNFQEALRLDPKFAEACSALGNVYVAQKDWKQAEAAFKQAMDLALPRSGKALFYADYKIVTGDPEAGKTVLQDLVKQVPDYLPAWLALAQLAGAQKDYAGGITLLGNVLGRNPRDLQALLLKADLERQLGQTAQATKDLEDLVRKFPESPVVYYQLARVQTDVNDFDKAAGNLNQALKLNPNYADATLLLAEIQMYQGNIDPAAASLQQLILQRPQFVPARLLLAKAYRMRGRLDSAVQIYRELERALPENPQIHLLLGTTLLEQKKNTEARAEFDKAFKLQPDFPALEKLVGLDIMEKQYVAASQRVQQQIDQYPKVAPLQLLLARIQLASGDTNQVQSTLQKIIAQTPDFIPAYVMLAQMYAAANENQKALADLATALTKDPTDTGALLLMAMTCNAEKDYDHAREAYEKLLTVASNNVVALNNLAYIYAENLGQIGKGEQLARRARDLAPADPSTADTLGWIYSRQGQYSSAVSLLRESAARLDTEPEVHYHLGMTYYWMGDEANARTTFRRALQLNQDFPEAKECKEYLAILEIDPKNTGADAQSLLEKRVASQPKDSLAQMRLAIIYEREGITDKAIAANEAVLQITPQNVPALMNLARLYSPKDQEKALNFAKNAYKVSPNDPLVTHTLGRLAFLTGDYPWSVNLLQLTVRNLPQDPEVLYDLGQALYSVGRVADARISMQNALKSGTSFSQADATRRFLAMTDLADKPVQALAAQTQVADILKSAPDYVPALMAKALIAEQKLDLSSAQQTYESVLSQYPDFAPAQRQLVKIYARDPKNDAKSYPLAVKVHQAFPDDPEVAMAFGVISYRRNDFTRAVSLLEESARQLNRDAELMYYLGMAQYQLKHSAQCKTALQQALNLNLPSPQADDAKKILAELK